MNQLKYLACLLPVLGMLILAACGRAAQETGPQVGDFFNFAPDTTSVIQSLEEEMANVNHTMFTSHVNADGSRIQQRINALNQDITIVLENRDGAVRQIFAWADFPLWEDVTGIEAAMELVILQEPLVVGNTWDNGVGGVSEITGMDMSLTTPAGAFTGVIQVTTVFEQTGDYSITYFAPGHGQIQDNHTTTFQGNEFSNVNQLIEVVSGEGLGATVFVLYPDDELLGLDYQAIDVEVLTNQNFAQLFTQLIQAHMPSLSDVTVQSLSIDRDNGLITVDFSRELLEVAAGSGAEQLLLYSLANMFGAFFWLPAFVPTVEGAIYESGHFSFADGESIPVGSGLQQGVAHE